MDYLIFSLPGVVYIFLMLVGVEVYRSLMEKQNFPLQWMKFWSAAFGIIMWVAWLVGVVAAAAFVYRQLTGNHIHILFPSLFFWTIIGNIPLYFVSRMIRMRAMELNLN